jgi:hypothetical protein
MYTPSLHLALSLTLELLRLALSLALELLRLSLGLASHFVRLALGLAGGLGDGLLDGVGDFLCSYTSACIPTQTPNDISRAHPTEAVMIGLEDGRTVRRGHVLGYEIRRCTDKQQMDGWGGDVRKREHVPPFSMPLTAAPEIVLSTALAASLMVSTGLLRAMGVVLKRRAWRAICARNMLIVCVIVFCVV